MPTTQGVEMLDSNHSNGIISAGADYDAVIVGASLAGCSAAILLARAGARVALVEKHADPATFKRICSHYIQPSGVPTIERLGLLEPALAAGGVRSHLRIWTRWGWIVPPPSPHNAGLNLRREKLDPLLRGMAARTSGVELLGGYTARALVHDDAGTVTGVVVHGREGGQTTLRGKLVVGADGRDSRIAELAGVPEKRARHERFAYGGYFAGGAPAHTPDATIWMTDPQWAAAFPTDDGLTFYAAMPTKPWLPEFKRDPEGMLVKFLSDQPEPPPIREGELVQPVLGKLDMENRLRRPVMPGLALIGDAALAIDPLWGVGCGWAFQSAEWLADAVGPALGGAESLDAGLQRYRKRHARGLRGHAWLMVDYARGRRFEPTERLIFSAAARDERVASLFEPFGTRQIGPARAFPRLVPLALAAHARGVRSRRNSDPAPPAPPASTREPEHEAVAA
ncbi:MAG TPA: NAD(P)/FAD-dependent oxidoreductase [Conexibacter sp.]|nr:NAD(P)/FAD-dependent oxidoreductase [Conexibacter sp.]